MESIQMQENGAREAVETIRKKLKHGDTKQKLCILEVNPTTRKLTATKENYI
jgi:hypothetical protein